MSYAQDMIALAVFLQVVVLFVWVIRRALR